MNYYTDYTKKQKLTSKEEVARHLRRGGIVVTQSPGTTRYDAYSLEGASKRCTKASFREGTMKDEVIYQGDDPWFAVDHGVVTPGVTAQIKELEED